MLPGMPGRDLASGKADHMKKALFTLIPLRPVFAAGLLFGWCAAAFATDYYIDTADGSDSSNGRSEANAWRTLSKAGSQNYNPGDRILLKRGETFPGKLYLSNKNGTSESPIVVGAYGSGAMPIIDAAGYRAGVHLENSSYFTVQDLEITADGGVTVDGSDPQLRYGVYVNVLWNGSVDSITLTNLYIHDIYPEQDKSSEGANPTTYMGTAIRLAGTGGSSVNFPASNLVVQDCVIERTGFKAVEMQRCDGVSVLNNRMDDIGGPALQPSRCSDVTVRDNIVYRSGALTDPRMHGRGSGIWPWGSDDVLIESNTFMNAVGREDSCGMHIDFNCNNVLVQYNLSINNAGGFIEILGNNNNCTYRYNVSINDGWRVQGVLDQGTIANNAHGRILFISGWVGSSGGTPNNYSGPFNTYIYNNTIFTPPGQTSHFMIHGTARGLKISNNIFYLMGPVGTEIKGWKENGSWTQNYKQEMIDTVVWENNLYEHSDSNPMHLPYGDTSPVIGDPLFLNRGSLAAEDYLPSSLALVSDQGIELTNLPGDPIGVVGGLAMAHDYFGTPIDGLPDMGAAEISGQPLYGYRAWLNEYAVAEGEQGDDDNDDLLNLYEYGLGGNPTNGFVDEQLAVFGPAGSGLHYIHVQRNDDTNLVYDLELTDDLVSGTWTDSGYTVTGTNTALGGDFDAVTNAIPATDPQTFIRMIIHNP
jgi:hypothetical protein